MHIRYIIELFIRANTYLCIVWTIYGEFLFHIYDCILHDLTLMIICRDAGQYVRFLKEINRASLSNNRVSLFE